MHPVIFHFEIRDAGARLFPALQLQQKLAAVILYGAQFIQFGIIAISDDAASTQHNPGSSRKPIQKPDKRRIRLHHLCQPADMFVGIGGHFPEKRHSRNNGGSYRGNRFRLSRNPDKSRGRADASAIRAVMRSISATRFRVLAYLKVRPRSTLSDQKRYAIKPLLNHFAVT